MKIKFFINISIFLIFSNFNLFADTIFFNSKNIKIENEGEMIYASKGVANIPSKSLMIEGDKFIYDKANSELTIFDNIKYIDQENDIIIKSQKMIYNELTNKILSKSKTLITVENNYEINSSDISYDRNLNKISTQKFTDVNDKAQNEFLSVMALYLMS